MGFPRTSTINTLPESRPRRQLRRRDTSQVSRERKIKLQLTHRSWLPSRKKRRDKLSEQRKKDQAAIDTQVLAAIKKEKEGQALRQYLKAPFALSKGQFPHTMSF